MELSRRGILAGLGVAGGVGAVGFVGAARVTDDEANDEAGGAVPVDPDAPFEARLVASDADDEDESDGDEDESEGANEDESDGDEDEPFLFDAADLDHVQTADEDADDEGANDEDTDDENADDESDETDEHLVYVSLSADGRAAFRDRLEATDATEDPASFAVLMTLDGDTVRRVDLDEPTVAALSDEDWNGVLELAFESETVAADVFESLAGE